MKPLLSEQFNNYITQTESNFGSKECQISVDALEQGRKLIGAADDGRIMRHDPFDSEDEEGNSPPIDVQQYTEFDGVMASYLACWLFSFRESAPAMEAKE